MSPLLGDLKATFDPLERLKGVRAQVLPDGTGLDIGICREEMGTLGWEVCKEGVDPH